jgi:hypothetical protein
LELIIPYALSLSGDERFVSMLMSLMGVATFLGSFLLSIGTHKGKRAKRIMFLSIITGMMMILFGISRSKLTLMGTLFLVMLPLPMVNALFKSILQNYVPLKMQGRVFSKKNNFIREHTSIVRYFSQNIGLNQNRKL